MPGKDGDLLGKPPITDLTEHNFDLRFGSSGSQRVAQENPAFDRTRKLDAGIGSPTEDSVGGTKKRLNLRSPEIRPTDPSQHGKRMVGQAATY